MDAHDFGVRLRAGERFHGLAVPTGVWPVLRVDGRAFATLTDGVFDTPYDERFADLMTATARALLTEFGARYAYTEGDEVSVLLDPGFDLFGRRVEKLVSVSAAVAAATFTHGAGRLAHFDSRVWLGATLDEVTDYFSWRQADADRRARTSWCYWTLRERGASREEASAALLGVATAEKDALLDAHGVRFADLPAWQRRGIGVWFRDHEHAGYDPVRQLAVTTTRRRVHVERELPANGDYREFVAGLAGQLV